MILYHPYAESLTDHPRLAATWRFLRNQAAMLRQCGWQIVHHPCGKDTRYEDGLLALWGRDHLVIFEQDLVPTASILDGLAQPHAPVCAQHYRLHRPQGHPQAVQQILRLVSDHAATLPDPLVRQILHHGALWQETTDPLVHRIIEGATERWATPEDRWADYAGFGLIRFTRDFQRRHRPGWRPGTWQDLDTRVSEWLISLAIPVHLHGPEIPHHHGCTCHAEASE